MVTARFRGAAVIAIRAAFALLCVVLLPACRYQRQTEARIRVGDQEFVIPWGVDAIVFKLRKIEEFQRMLLGETVPLRRADLQAAIDLWVKELAAERPLVPPPSSLKGEGERFLMRKHIDAIVVGALECIDRTIRARIEDLDRNPDLRQSAAYDEAYQANLRFFQEEVRYWDNLKKR